MLAPNAVGTEPRETTAQVTGAGLSPGRADSVGRAAHDVDLVSREIQ